MWKNMKACIIYYIVYHWQCVYISEKKSAYSHHDSSTLLLQVVFSVHRLRPRQQSETTGSPWSSCFFWIPIHVQGRKVVLFTLLLTIYTRTYTFFEELTHFLKLKFLKWLMSRWCACLQRDKWIPMILILKIILVWIYCPCSWICM